MEELLDRETQMTTYLGNGVCLPHARAKMKRPYMIAVGRCPKGLEFKVREITQRFVIYFYY